MGEIRTVNQVSTRHHWEGQHFKSECDTLVVEHVLQAGVMRNWIVDSGATCHMCYDEVLFSEVQLLEKETDLTLGNGHTLRAKGKGKVP